MTDDLANAAREALAGVTEGPWHVTECGDYWVEHKQPLANADGDFRGIALCGDTAWPHADTRQIEWENNARFIALSRSLVPALADRIEALQAQLKTVCQRESETTARYDARIETLEADNARLRNLTQLHHVIDDLASGQKPLGAEFEAVLEAHLDELYEG